MKQLILRLTDIPVGTMPVDALYKRIKETYPAVALNKTNSYIDLIQGFASKYNARRAVVRLKSKTDPTVIEEFYYDRFDIELSVKNPLFTQAELPALIAGTEPALLAAIGKKIKCALTEDDFWVEPHQFVSIGGTQTPNFRLKSRFNSPYWFGEVIVNLHRQTPPPV